MLKTNQLYNENCLDTMAKMPDKFVDLVYADPPFNAGFEYENWTDENEYIKFCNAWYLEARRVSKNLLITPGNKNIYYYPKPLGLVYLKTSSSISSIAYLDPIEILLVYDKPIERLGSTELRFKLNKYKNNHPCSDSEEMVAFFIDKWTVKGALIYDPFMGSGTTAEQAIKYDRNFIGSEISAEYCKIATKRIKAEMQKIDMFK